MGHYDADGPQHCVGIRHAPDHRVLSGGPAVCPGLQHGGGGDAVGAQGPHLRLGQTGLDPLHQQLAQPAALAVDDYDFHVITSSPCANVRKTQRHRRTPGIEWVRWWCIMNLSSGDSRELLALAIALSLCLARDQDQAELGRLAAFFTVVGDTLALFALQPDLRPPDQGVK